MEKRLKSNCFPVPIKNVNQGNVIIMFIIQNEKLIVIGWVQLFEEDNVRQFYNIG